MHFVSQQNDFASGAAVATCPPRLPAGGGGGIGAVYAYAPYPANNAAANASRESTSARNARHSLLAKT
ncbi:MAG: hypothetical protein PHR77_21150 [Kiritimatiellae bacterium]|nr:hypothetical protein [Kiritimatiellia bacterium]MDD5520309.1 hypothetical protein [Kiritimatiellia bacterium]